jgi:hypothetical protein
MFDPNAVEFSICNKIIRTDNQNTRGVQHFQQDAIALRIESFHHIYFINTIF